MAQRPLDDRLTCIAQREGAQLIETIQGPLDSVQFFYSDFEMWKHLRPFGGKVGEEIKMSGKGKITEYFLKLNKRNSGPPNPKGKTNANTIHKFCGYPWNSMKGLISLYLM